MSNSQTKFGWILSNGLGGDSITDGWTEGDEYNIPFAFFKKHGDKNLARGQNTMCPVRLDPDIP